MGNDDISGEIQKWVAEAGEGQDYGRRWWGGGQRINRTDTGHNILVDTEMTQVITEVSLD